MTIYIDVFFTVNFLIDFFLIFIAGKISGSKILFKRILLSSAAASGYACIKTIFSLEIFMDILSLPIIMCIAYKVNSIASLVKKTAVFYMCTLISGGICLAIGSISGTAAFMEGIFYFDFPIIYSLLSIALCAFVCFLVSPSKESSLRKKYVDITIEKNGKFYSARAFIDSGNMCYDYFTGFPVIICEDIFSNEEITTRKMPYKTAAGSFEMEIFIPDRVIIKYKNKVYLNRSVVIGVSEVKLSQGEEFNALIGGAVFDGLEKGIYEDYKGNFV